MSKNLYELYRGAMAYIEVRKPSGDIGLGSAFHVGNGVFITARHVLDQNEIRSIGTTEECLVPDKNGNAHFKDDPQRYRIQSPVELSG